MGAHSTCALGHSSLCRCPSPAAASDCDEDESEPVRAAPTTLTTMARTAFFLLLFAVTARAQTPVDTIRQLDARWARMYAESDTVTAMRLYADDLIFTSTDGSMKDKAKEMNDVRAAPGLTLHYFRPVNPEIRVFGSGAVAAGLAEWSFTMNGQKSDVKRRYTIVYGRGGALGWRIMAVHMGRAP